VQFKVHQQDWRDKVRDEEVFCAFCSWHMRRRFAISSTSTRRAGSW
jgi:hypothetical protein